MSTAGSENNPPGPAPPPAHTLSPMPESAVLMQEGKQRFVPDRRELERSPALLRIAAAILVLGSLLPWTGHGGGVFTIVIAKLVAALSIFLFYAAVLSRTKDPVPAGLGALAKKRWGKPYSHKTSGFAETLAHAIPTPLHVLGLLTLVASLVIAYLDPQIQAAGAEGFAGYAAAEIGLLLIGGLTLAHIYAYQRGAHFSPLYPFMFLAPIMLGVPRLITYLAQRPLPLIPALGATICTAAGFFAVYTIVLAMMEAKKEGDAKKAAALEQRRNTRRTAKA